MPETKFPDTMIAARISPDRIERKFSTPRWQAKIDHRTKALRAKKWLGKKKLTIFLPAIFLPTPLNYDDKSQPGSDAVLPVPLAWSSISAPQDEVSFECQFPTNRESARRHNRITHRILFVIREQQIVVYQVRHISMQDIATTEDP